VTPEPKAQLTPEEYLAIERSTRAKSEFFEGQVFAMGSASVAHTQIVTNLVGELRNQLKGGALPHKR
jgi:Uma2 family endonuclease